jgi:ankyrin repeat protein
MVGRGTGEACRYGHWNIVKWLVNNTQVDVNYADIDSNNILHRVISFNPTNPLLHSAVLYDMTELCRLVYVCGEDVNVQDNYNGDTPLHRACYI